MAAPGRAGHRLAGRPRQPPCPLPRNHRQQRLARQPGCRPQPPPPGQPRTHPHHRRYLGIRVTTRDPDVPGHAECQSEAEQKHQDLQQASDRKIEPQHEGSGWWMDNASLRAGLSSRARDVIEGADAWVLPAGAPDQAKRYRGQVVDRDEYDVVTVEDRDGRAGRVNDAPRATNERISFMVRTGWVRRIGCPDGVRGGTIRS